MPALHPRINQLPPNLQQVLLLRPKQVNPLAARDFAVQPVLLRNLAHDDELPRCDLSSRYTGHDGKGAVALDIGHEAVVGFLEIVVRAGHYVLVEEAREDGGDGWLADFAPE